MRHIIEKSARGEAERLALANPGHEFYVLEAICCAKKVEVAIEELVHPDYLEIDIPF